MIKISIIFNETILSKTCDIKNMIEQWISDKYLQRLVELFEGNDNPEECLEDRISHLVKFSDRWDFRNRQKNASASAENARWTVEDDPVCRNNKEFILQAANELGLIGCGTPLKEHYDYVLVLGGARMSCLYRMKYSQEICNKMGIHADHIVGLSGLRSVMDSERCATNTYAPNADTELDLMRAAMMQVYGNPELLSETGDTFENLNRSWKIEHYKNEIPVSLLAAPSAEPEKRRANTADTFEFFFNKLNIPPENKLLMITSQIYVPYQQMEAIRILGMPYNLSVETIGFPTEWSSGLQGLQKPENYLQEIRSVLQSMERLLTNIKR